MFWLDFLKNQEDFAAVLGVTFSCKLELPHFGQAVGACLVLGDLDGLLASQVLEFTLDDVKEQGLVHPSLDLTVDARTTEIEVDVVVLHPASNAILVEPCVKQESGDGLALVPRNLFLLLLEDDAAICVPKDQCVLYNGLLQCGSLVCLDDEGTIHTNATLLEALDDTVDVDRLFHNFNLFKFMLVHRELAYAFLYANSVP